MIRLFCLFVDWCSARCLHASDYQVVIVPKTVEAEARFKRAWDKEFADLRWDHPAAGGLYDGLIAGVPFKIERFKPCGHDWASRERTITGQFKSRDRS